MLRAPGGSPSTVTRSGAGCGGPGHGGKEPRRRWFSVSMNATARGRERCGKQRGNAAELTGRSTTGSAGSGTAGRRRIRRWSPAAVLGEDDSRRRCRAPAVEWVGVDDAEAHGGSSGPIGEARDGRWPRLWRQRARGVSAMVERARGRRGGERTRE